MSSAKNLAIYERPSARSFIYIKNKRGPSMESWGTPAVTSDQEADCPLRTTLCFLSLKKFNNRFKRLPDMPFYFSLKIRPSCHILSKALDISRNTLRTSKPTLNDWWISWVIHKGWLMQESLDLKPDLCWDIRSFSIKNSNILLNINRSKILLHVGSKDIGR